MEFSPRSSAPPPRRGAPPNYFSRAVQLRLWVAVGSLMLVLVLMVEARKPENWRWMWAGEPSSQLDELDELDTRLAAGSQPPGDPPGTVYGVREDTLQHAASELVSSSQPHHAQLEHRVWAEILKQLSHEQRLALDRLFKAARRADSSPTGNPGWVAAFERIDSVWQRYAAEVAAAIAAPPDRGDAPQPTGVSQLTGEARRAWQTGLDRLTRDWNEKYEPALRAPINGRPWTTLERDALVALQPLIDELSLEAVRDNTVSRPVEQYSWFRLLEQLQQRSLSDLQQDALSPVSFVQLFRQPEQYRGKLVTIRGRARLAARVAAPNNIHGITHYFLFYIAPAGGQRSPFMIYSLSVPPGFPTVAEGEYTDIQQDVEVTGFFFKRQAYRARDGVNTVPLILAKTLTWQPSPTNAAPPLPGGATLALAALGLFGLSLLLAWLIHRSTTRPFAALERIAPPSQVRFAGLAQRDQGTDIARTLQRLGQEPDTDG